MKKPNKELNPQASIPEVTPMKNPKPIYWKQVLITTLSVYPLLIGSTWFLKVIFPMEELAQEIVIFFTITMVASLMVFPVIPFIMKLLGAWPYKNNMINNINIKIMKSITNVKKNHLLDTKMVRLNKFNLHIRYAELGEKTNPTMLLLHGVPENLHSWYVRRRLFG